MYHTMFMFQPFFFFFFFFFFLFQGQHAGSESCSVRKGPGLGHHGQQIDFIGGVSRTAAFHG